jgi:hypothetical protein
MIRIKASFLCFLLAAFPILNILSDPTRAHVLSTVETALFWAMLGIGFKTRQIYWR